MVLFPKNARVDPNETGLMGSDKVRVFPENEPESQLGR